MNDRCETVQIKGKSGPVTVNKSDYDADQAEGGARSMKLYKGAEPEAVEPFAPSPPAPPAPSAPFAPSPPTPPAIAPPVAPNNSRLVGKDGKKYYAIDGATGERLAIDGINPAGYASEAEAWAAIKLLPH